MNRTTYCDLCSPKLVRIREDEYTEPNIFTINAVSPQASFQTKPKKAFAMVFNKVRSNKHTLTSYKPISVPYTFQYLFLNLACFKQYGIQHMFLCLLEE